MEFENPVTFDRSWSSNDLTISTNRIEFEGVSYNSRLAPGQSASFGFSGGHDGNLGNVRCSAL